MFEDEDDERNPVKLRILLKRPNQPDLPLSEGKDLVSLERALSKGRPTEFRLRNHSFGETEPEDAPTTGKRVFKSEIHKSLEKHFPDIVVPDYPDIKFLRLLKETLHNDRYFTYENSLENIDNLHNVKVIESAGSALNRAMERMLSEQADLYQTPNSAEIGAQALADSICEEIQNYDGASFLAAGRSEFFKRNIHVMKEHDAFAKEHIITSHTSANNAVIVDEKGNFVVAEGDQAFFSCGNSGARCLQSVKNLSYAEVKANTGPAQNGFHVPTEVNSEGVNDFAEEYFLTGNVALTAMNGLKQRRCHRRFPELGRTESGDGGPQSERFRF